MAAASSAFSSNLDEQESAAREGPLVRDRVATCRMDSRGSFGARRLCVRPSSAVCSAAGLGGLEFESD